MGKKVIIIDDDENTVKFLSVVLEENGYEPLAAYDGREGMEKLQQNKVDLVVLDVMMPAKSGFVVFSQMKKDERLRDIPVLMLTGVAAALEEQDAKAGETFERPYDSLREVLRQKIDELRGEGHVTPEMFVDKPVDPDTFIEKVRRLTGD